MVRNADDKADEGGGRLFPDGHDREWIPIEEACAIAGCDRNSFLCGLQAGTYPAGKLIFAGFDGRGRKRWEQRWQRGAVVRAVEDIARRAQVILGRPT